MDKSLRLLQNLATYKFLAISQFELLGWTQSKKSLYHALSLLKEKGLIDSTSYRYNPKFGRVEDIHYLKSKGEKYLQQTIWISSLQVKLPINHKGFFDDYQHRKMTINCHILLRTAFEKNGISMLFYEQYFERIKRAESKYRKTATKIHVWSNYLIADAIFCIEKSINRSLFCLEFHRGRRVLKVEKQSKQYAYALAGGAISTKYSIPSNPKIIVVFEKQSTLETTLERLSQDHFYTYLKSYYLFKSYDDLKLNPLDHRIDLSHKAQSLCPLSDSFS